MRLFSLIRYFLSRVAMLGGQTGWDPGRVHHVRARRAPPGPAAGISTADLAHRYRVKMASNGVPGLTGRPALWRLHRAWARPGLPEDLPASLMP
jgi:hypothetical protein